MPNEINFSDIKTQRAAIIILVGIISAGLIWYFLISPQAQKFGELKATAVRKQEELNQILSLRPQLDKMRVEVAQLQREMDSLEAIFPMNPDVPGLITDIAKIARNQRITIMNFKPSGTLAKEYYVENYYEISVLGSYHKIGIFFAQIANFDLLVNIDKINAKVSSALASDLQNFEKYKGEKKSDEILKSVMISFRITTYSSLQETGK